MLGGVSLVLTSCAAPGGELIVHYYHPEGAYDEIGLAISGDSTENSDGKSARTPDNTDDFGAIYSITLKQDAKTLTLSTLRAGEEDLGGPLTLTVSGDGGEIWIYSGLAQAFDAPALIPAADEAIVYYQRGDQEYTDWGLHVWEDTTETVTWQAPLPIDGTDAFGAYWKVGLAPDAEKLGFIIHKGDTKDPGPDQFLLPATMGRRIWRLQDDATIYTHPIFPTSSLKIDAAKAQWLTPDTIAWDVSGDATTLQTETFKLHQDRTAKIVAKDDKIQGGTALTLTFDPAGLSEALKEQYPNLASYEVFKLSEGDAATAAEMLKGQLVVSHTGSDGKIKAATGMQLPGVLDSLFATDTALGLTWNEDTPTLRLWAPTAQSVALLLFDDPADTTPERTELSASAGVYEAVGDASWKGKYYQYEVVVYAPSSGKIETNVVTDPYAIGLSRNSTHSQILNLSDQSLKPAGWDAQPIPPLRQPEDIVLYELHVRDFSMSDARVPDAIKGTYGAFAVEGSAGRDHLRDLAQAGLTHIHLLPIFDIATIDEDRTQHQTPPDLSGYAPDGEEQQAEVEKIKDSDGFNWGYDPYHYTTPEGAYALNPEDGGRTVELREAVQSLHELGLRVVMDVVYNHTNASGQNDKSVLDKVVPGYYHRLNAKGQVETSTCCQNTATEHTMMEKLMIDSLLTWARDYKIDGFRFDLMGHHMKSNMLNAKAALEALTVARDGVDGRTLYLYGEGWDFGEVGNNARGENATQLNMAGTGIGTFNDRLRDAVRGGGPFDSGTALQKQGFASGLYTDPNSLDQGTEEEQRQALLKLSDQIRIGLTGNLADYSMVAWGDATVTGSQVPYGASPTGYTQDPQEAITYVEAHDNETLFDIYQYKLPGDTTLEERVRAQTVALSLVMLGQGIPFLHAGSELLRSKSMDRNSYNSGDWFNTLDLSGQSSSFGRGLPPEQDNGNNWSLMQPILADDARMPEAEHMQSAFDQVLDLLRLRKAHPLFRLGTEERVMERLVFYNTGSEQQAGVIVMALIDDDTVAVPLDPTTARMVVIFNACPDTITFEHEDFAGGLFELSSLQQAGVDEVVKDAFFTGATFSVPGRTTAVFVEPDA